MGIIDNSKIFLGGIYGDAIVKVAANTTLKKGTVLCLNADNDIVAFTTDLNSDSFVAEPTYILAQDLVNGTNAAANYELVRVFESGEVNAAKVIFVKDADASNAQVLAKMKNNGFHLANVQELS